MQMRSKTLRGILTGALLFCLAGGSLAGCVVGPEPVGGPYGSYYAGSPYYADNGYYGGDYDTAIIVEGGYGGGRCCRDHHGRPPAGWQGRPSGPGGFHGGPPGGFHGAPGGGFHGSVGGTRPK